MNIHKFLDSLAANASRNFKIEQLKANSNNITLREVIRLATDPFTQFYQRKIPPYEQTYKTTFGLEWAFQLLKKLSSREVTGNKAIEHLTYILSSLNEDNAKVVVRIIEKDLRAGFSEGTANKVWPNLVQEYPCMLCSPFEQKLVDKIKFPAYAQMKMDGMRFNAIVRGGKVEFRSRNGKQIHLLGNLESEFAALAGDVDYIFDGELLVNDGGVVLDRQTGNGILNKANKGTISDLEAQKVHASVWDLIPYVLFETGYCGTPYSTRFLSLEKLVSKQPAKGKKIWSVTSTIVETLDEAQEIFQKYLMEGHEGIILKDGNGVWEDKRSKTQIKFKGELECDLMCVDWVEGTGKNVGRLGALVLESSDGNIKVNVGTGFTDNDRDSITKKVIGRVIAIKYNSRIIDHKSGVSSLFLPVFLEWRHDKYKADSSEVIK